MTNAITRRLLSVVLMGSLPVLMTACGLKGSLFYPPGYPNSKPVLDDLANKLKSKPEKAVQKDREGGSVDTGISQ